MMNDIRSTIIARRKPEIESLHKLCKEYLETAIPMQNVTSIDEFQPYLKLFSREQVSSMSQKDLNELSYQYSYRFSQHDPIFVIDPLVEDANGKLWKGDGKKHKVLLELPPRLKRLDSLNVLGPQAGQIAVECMANSRSTGNALSDKTKYYSEELRRLMILAQQKTGSVAKQDAEFSKYEERLLHKKENPEPKTEPKEEKVAEPKTEDPSPLDAEWD